VNKRRAKGRPLGFLDVRKFEQRQFESLGKLRHEREIKVDSIDPKRKW
jgi:hypothetical protein